MKPRKVTVVLELTSAEDLDDMSSRDWWQRIVDHDPSTDYVEVTVDQATAMVIQPVKDPS